MADKKITELTELVTPADEDLLAIVDDPSGNPETRKITRGNFLGGAPVKTDTISEKTSAAGVTVDGLKIKDGRVVAWDCWMPAEETWTYASATTITVPSGAASKYSKGDKIKLTQTSVKYFYIIGVADTLLTVTGGSNYSVADAAITANYYSKVANPQGFPHWFNYTPTWSAGGSMTYTSVSNEAAIFTIIGTMVVVAIRGNGTTGGTPNPAIMVTTPTNMASDGYFRPHTGAYCNDGGAKAGLVVDTGVANKVCFIKYDNSNWGLGSSRIVATTLIYDMV